MKKIIFSSLIRCCFYLSVVINVPVNAQTIIYTYDVLGRVTFVEDSVNGNRDYDYDFAGNRLKVTGGNVIDEPVPPAAPTGLSCSMISQGAYRGSWSSVAGATYYVYRTTSAYEGNEYNVTGTTTVANSSCKWVRACSSNNVCSSKSYF